MRTSLKPLTITTPDGAALSVHRRAGDGPRVVLVHGSLDDHTTWHGVIDRLDDRFDVVTYDRRGHSASTAPPGQGTIGQDVADLAAVIAAFDRRPALAAGHSYGATVALVAAVTYGPEAIAAAVGHEPPMFAALKGDDRYASLRAAIAESMTAAAAQIEAGDVEAGVQRFVDEVAFGAGAWTSVFPAAHRRLMIANAATWLDQYRDPQRLALGAAELAAACQPIVVTSGDASLPSFGAALDAVLTEAPNVRRVQIPGAAHAAPLTHPAELAEVIADTAGDLETPR